MHEERLRIITAAAAQLQKAESAPPKPPTLGPGASGSATVKTRVMVQRAEDCPPVAIPELITISLPIPGFQPGDGEDHVYYMSTVRRCGSGGATVSPDRHGVLTRQWPVRSSDPGDAGAPDNPQYYFTATHKLTREARVTLDLRQVHVWPFLNSLQFALAGDIPAPDRLRALRGLHHAVRNLIRGTDDLTFNISGERLTVDEVLDVVYLETACVVSESPSGLAIVAIP